MNKSLFNRKLKSMDFYQNKTSDNAPKKS